MSKLSERCMQCMQNNDYTVYTLSKSSGLDRASLHRLVTGKRTPTREFLLNFCTAMRINEYDKNEILELFEEEKVGSMVYQNRKCIVDLFHQIYQAKKKSRISSFSAPFSSDLLPFTDTPLTTKTQISRLLETVFHSYDEDVFISTNLPPMAELSFDFTMNYFYLKFQKRIHVEHLLTVVANPSQPGNENHNLTQLAHILPFALSDFHNYVPHYTYAHISQSDFEQLLYPYYVITKDYVLELSSDLSHSILHKKPLHVATYLQEFQKIFTGARSLMQITPTPEAALDLYMEISWPSQVPMAALLPQPSFTSSIPQELFSESFQAMNPSVKLTEQLRKLFTFPEKSPNIPCYFTMEGLIYFLKTGLIRGQVSAFLRPLTVCERREILSRFLEANHTGFTGSRLLKLDIQVAENLYVELLPNQQLIFCRFLPDMKVHFALIQESSIYESFVDFFSYLSEPCNCYSIEETNQIIQKCMDDYLPVTKCTEEHPEDF